MSLSATLYRVSKDTYRKLKQSSGQQQFDITSAKNYVTFHGSFWGLEYVLSKEQNESTIELVSQIFAPHQSFGVEDFDSLTSDEKHEQYENLIFYLETEMISKLNNFLDSVAEVDIRVKYDADELNEKGIYPRQWSSDDSLDIAFNKRHFMQEFIELKTIIAQADKDQDYIFVYVG